VSTVISQSCWFDISDILPRKRKYGASYLGELGKIAPRGTHPLPDRAWEALSSRCMRSWIQCPIIYVPFVLSYHCHLIRLWS
jgi:hypothetical protein